MDEIIMNNSNAGHTKIDADIILTRGLLAQILANLPGDIPVVQISVPTADILRTIRKCTQLYGQKQIGIIAAGNMLAGITGLSDLCDVPIKTYLLSPNWNNEALADQAIREGCQVILGGLNTCRYAQMIHVPNMLIATSAPACGERGGILGRPFLGQARFAYIPQGAGKVHAPSDHTGYFP